MSSFILVVRLPSEVYFLVSKDMETWGNTTPQLVGVGLSIDALVSLSRGLLVKQPTSYSVYANTRQLEHFPGL